MRYAYYEVWRNGQKIKAGYSVPDICNHLGCSEQIDRGLAHLCGTSPGGDEHGCGGYFCEDHQRSKQIALNEYISVCLSCVNVPSREARDLRARLAKRGLQL